jgi:arginase
MKFFKKANIVTAYCWQGQKTKGVDIGSKIMLNYIMKNYEETIKSIYKVKEKKFNNNRGYNIVYNKVLKNLQKNNQLSILLGGDHSISAGSLASSKKSKKIDKIIWFDAHADINTYRTSYTGNKHGMPVASAMHLIEPWVKSKQINYEDIIYIGLRDIDLFEKKFIENNNITYFDMNNIRRTNIYDMFYELNRLIEDKNIHISIDIDVLDSRLVPCTGTPVEGGLELNELFKILYFIHSISNIYHYDIVEFNPNIGNASNLKTTNNTVNKILDMIWKIHIK